MRKLSRIHVIGFEKATTYRPELIGENVCQAGRTPEEQLGKQLVAYYLGNWYGDFNNDDVADPMLFDSAQDSLARSGLPEVSISHAITIPDLSAPAAPVIATTQFDHETLQVSLAGQETPNGGSSEGQMTHALVCTDGASRYQTTNPSGSDDFIGTVRRGVVSVLFEGRKCHKQIKQASFTTDAIVPETAGVQGRWPVWFLYEASWAGKTEKRPRSSNGVGS